VKILIIQSWIRLGGAELISVRLAEQLQARGHEAGIACVYADLEGMPAGAERVDYFSPAGWLSRLCQRNRAAFLLLAPWLLLALTWKHGSGIDVLNPHNFPASWVAVLVGAIKRIPVVWTCNEPPERMSLRPLEWRRLGDYLGWWLASSWIDRSIIRYVKSIYVPSVKTQLDVSRRYRRQAEIVRIGTDTGFQEVPQKPGLLEARAVRNPGVLSLVGKLHPQKNQIVCIRAMPVVLQQFPDAVLVLAGEGPWKGRLEKEVAKLGLGSSVRFLGRLDQAGIRSLYQEASLNLFPALNQSWGLTPFEALCAGTLSIVSNECGAAEVIAEQNIGIVCQPTPEAFAQAIIQTLRRREDLGPSVQRGRSFVVRNLTWSRYADTVIGIFTQTVSGHSTARIERVASQGSRG